MRGLDKTMQKLPEVAFQNVEKLRLQHKYEQQLKLIDVGRIQTLISRSHNSSVVFLFIVQIFFYKNKIDCKLCWNSVAYFQADITT